MDTASTMDEVNRELVMEICHCLITYKNQTQLLAHRYLELGQIWHNLPFQLRWHSKLLPIITDHCTEALTVTSRRELPLLITLLGTLALAFHRAEAALERDDTTIAGAMANAIWNLVVELEDRVTDLELGLETMETLKGICDLEGQVKWWDEERHSGSKLREAWVDALPGMCFVMGYEDSEENQAYEAEDERGEAGTEGR